MLKQAKNKGMMKETDMRHPSDLGNQALCRTTATAHILGHQEAHLDLYYHSAIIQSLLHEHYMMYIPDHD